MRKKPKTVEEVFHELEQYIMMIIAKEWPNEMKHDKATEK
jgi:hypothetical protein